MTYQKLKPFQDTFFHLCLLSFTSGAVVMSMELIVSRILTPVFGSSIYTWGSLIGLILAGLSLGYFLGGKISDNDPKFRKICSIIFSAGLYIVLYTDLGRSDVSPSRVPSKLETTTPFGSRRSLSI